MKNNGVMSVRLGPELDESIQNSADKDNRTKHNYVLNVLTKHENGELTDKKYVKKIEDFMGAVLNIPIEDAKKLQKMDGDFFEKLKELKEKS